MTPSSAGGPPAPRRLGAPALGDPAGLLALLLAGDDPAERWRPLAARIQAQLAACGAAGGSWPAIGEDLGLPPPAAARLRAVLALAQRWGPGAALPITSPAAARLLFLDLETRRTERVAVWYLTAAHRPIARRTVALGGGCAAAVQVRDVLAPALRLDAEAILVGHNHPGGSPEPSDGDLEFTTRLSQAANLLGVELLDHLVVAPGQVWSMRHQRLAGQDSWA